MKKRSYPTSLPFEFIDVQPINDRISKCLVKVLYHGKNRNKTYISKAVGNEIANSLPRTPIVGFYDEADGDFQDHGEEIIINKKGVSVKRKTRPYGAISEWGTIGWKVFLDPDGVEREYLVADGYLWTGRYPEVQSVINEGKGQSLEFFEDSIQGNWATFENEDEQFFIFNEAEISALCILGDTVEPCFESAEIGAAEEQYENIFNYSLNKTEFKKEFDEFLSQLGETNERSKYMLIDKDGNPIDEIESIEQVSTEVSTEMEVQDNQEVETQQDAEVEVETATEATEEVAVETVEDTVEVVETVEEVASADENVETFSENDGQKSEIETEVSSSTVEEPETLFTLEQYNELQSRFDAISAKYEALVAKENEVIEQKKTELIDKFALILGEDATKLKSVAKDYSLEQLDDKLAAIAFKKGVSFQVNEEESISIPKSTHSTIELPSWLQAVEMKQNKQ